MQHNEKYEGIDYFCVHEDRKQFHLVDRVSLKSDQQLSRLIGLYAQMQSLITYRGLTLHFYTLNLQKITLCSQRFLRTRNFLVGRN